MRIGGNSIGGVCAGRFGLPRLTALCVGADIRLVWEVTLWVFDIEYDARDIPRRVRPTGAVLNVIKVVCACNDSGVAIKAPIRLM